MWNGGNGRGFQSTVKSLGDQINVSLYVRKMSLYSVFYTLEQLFLQSIIRIKYSIYFASLKVVLTIITGNNPSKSVFYFLYK